MDVKYIASGLVLVALGAVFSFVSAGFKGSAGVGPVQFAQAEGSFPIGLVVGIPFAIIGLVIMGYGFVHTAPPKYAATSATIPRSAKFLRSFEGLGSRAKEAEGKFAEYLTSRGYHVGGGHAEADMVISRGTRRANVYFTLEGTNLRVSYLLVTKTWFKVLGVILFLSIVGIIPLLISIVIWYLNGRSANDGILNASTFVMSPPSAFVPVPRTETLSEQKPISSTPQPTGKRYCFKCGAELRENAAFCSSCGMQQ